MKPLSPIATKLAELRSRTGLSVGAVAKELGYSSPTGYFHYESRYKKHYLPQELVVKLARLFSAYGVAEGEVLALGGIDRSLDALPQGDYFNIPLLTRILTIIREEMVACHVTLSITQEAQAISHLYELAVLEGKASLMSNDLAKEAKTIVRFMKRNS